MDIVVRTPHGDADVSIRGHDPSTTLGDVIGTITGQAAPRLALVDGRAVDCSCRLDDTGLLVGSVVTTEPSLPVPASPDTIDLVQIAGHGAGRIVRLGAGRHRIGPGRRSSAPELDAAPVDRPMIDLVVESPPTASAATVVPLEPDVALNGEPISDATTWGAGILTVGTRAFRVEQTPAPAGVESPRAGSGRAGSLSDGGTIPFNRPPRRRAPSHRHPVVDAWRDATSWSPRLWERRPHHDDAFALPFGLANVGGSEESNANAEVELAIETGVAIVGSDRFREGLVRTLVVEAVTLHGPADLDLVVFTSPERIGDWDWAKWLPHLRLEGGPAILSSESDIERWMDLHDGAGSGAGMRWPGPHLTIALLDDPALWRQHRSPLRPVLSHTPTDVKVVALCDDPSHAPAICSAMISETDTGRARLHSFRRDTDIEDIWPSLTETSVAADVARALAPLVDVEVPSGPLARTGAPLRLDELLAVGDAEEVLARWETASPPSTVTIGHRDHQSVEVARAADVTTVVGTSMNDAFAVGASFLVQQSVDESPDALWILPLVMTDDGRAAPLWELPHATERHDASAPIDAHRLLARIRAVLEGEAGPERIVVVAQDSHLSPASPDEELLEALVEGARTTNGLSVLVITDRWERAAPDATRWNADTVVRVQRGHDATRGRSATVTTSDGRRNEPFTPPSPSSATIPALEILPLVIGRPPTALERRLELERARAGDTPDPALRAAVDMLRRAARSRPAPDGTRRVLVPPPLPTRVALDELFRSSPGDGVPLGLGDDPATGELRPRWWAPGQGSVLALGSRRSGIEQVPTVITLGLLDRFAPDDVRLVVLDPSASRRRALGTIDPAPVVRAADVPTDVAATFDEIDAELHRNSDAAATATSALPRLVVVIPDLSWLRRQITDDALAARVDAVLTRASEVDSGVDIVAYAGDLAGAGPFATHVARRLVGATSDRSDLVALGIERPSDLEGVVGRCRWFPGADLVQLALPDDDLETMLARRAAGGTP